MLIPFVKIHVNMRGNHNTIAEAGRITSLQDKLRQWNQSGSTTTATLKTPTSNDSEKDLVNPQDEIEVMIDPNRPEWISSTSV